MTRLKEKKKKKVSHSYSWEVLLEKKKAKKSFRIYFCVNILILSSPLGHFSSVSRCVSVNVSVRMSWARQSITLIISMLSLCIHCRLLSLVSSCQACLLCFQQENLRIEWESTVMGKPREAIRVEQNKRANKICRSRGLWIVLPQCVDKAIAWQVAPQGLDYNRTNNDVCPPLFVLLRRFHERWQVVKTKYSRQKHPKRDKNSVLKYTIERRRTRS